MLRHELSDPEVVAVEREIAGNVVRWVRSGMPTCGFTKLQRRQARALLVDVGDFWRRVRDDRSFESSGYVTFDEALAGRWGVTSADADAVMRMAARCRARVRARDRALRDHRGGG